MWVDSYQPALELLSQILPFGLVAYLHTRADEVLAEDTNQEESSIAKRKRRLFQHRKARQTVGTVVRSLDNFHKTGMDPSSGQVSNIQSSVVHTSESTFEQWIFYS